MTASSAVIHSLIRAVTQAYIPSGPVLCIATVIAVVAGSTGSAAECPQAAVQLEVDSGEFRYPLAVLDTTNSDPAFTSRASHDLPIGTIGLSLTPVGGEDIHLVVADAYELVGLPPGTEVDARLALEYQGSIGTPGCAGTDCSAFFAARVFDQFFDAEALVRAPASSGEVSRHETLHLPVRLAAGNPKVIAIAFLLRVAAGGYHGGQWIGQIRFVDLPEGARVISCHGYGGAPTPVSPTTWGRVKTIYR